MQCAPRRRTPCPAHPPSPSISPSRSSKSRLLRSPGPRPRRHRFTRAQFAHFVATTAPATLVMEACGTAARLGAPGAEAHGHRVVLLPPHAVRPYVPRNKTDREHTGLLEAVRNEALRPVPVKSVAQQALTALHRLRSTWLATRTARLNTVRGLLREFVAIPVGARQVRPAVTALLADPDSALPAAVRPALQSALDELAALEERLRTIEQQLSALAAELPAVTSLRTIPGVGLLTATALVGFVGDAHRFPTARHFASFLGLTPREHSSGARRRASAPSASAATPARMLLTHGARSVLCHAKRPGARAASRNGRSPWRAAAALNPAAIALANTLARIAWAVWTTDTPFAALTCPPETGPAKMRVLHATNREGEPRCARAGSARSRSSRS
ncbi:MAG: IS110 family transposase [Candidatus Binatia bacterium]